MVSREPWLVGNIEQCYLGLIRLDKTEKVMTHGVNEIEGLIVSEKPELIELSYNER